MNAKPRILCLTVVALFAIGCSTLGPRQEAAPEIAFIGVSGQHVLALHTLDGAAALVGTSEELLDVGALTYDRATNTIYGVTDHTRIPKLVTIDPQTGAATLIGPITQPRSQLFRVEGLAFNASDGVLYAAGGKSAFASNRLLSVDPKTGAAKELARIRGTLQNEIDAMAFASGVLYATDSVAGSTRLYRIDLATGEATAQGEAFTQTVTDLDFHPDAYRLFGTVASQRVLVALTLGGGEPSEIGPTHGEADFEGAPMTALAFTGTPGATMLFADDFESGDLSAWPKSRKR